MQAILDQLNAEQRAAVLATEGPVLVLAGAGSGKTRVITVRMAYLLHRGVKPHNVLAMTFTNKAATEMKERVGALVGKPQASELTVGTFHSFCVRVLREHGRCIGLPENFSICDASDQQSAVKGALRELAVSEATLQPALLLARISLAKNRNQTPEQYLAGASDSQEELVGRAWQRYTAHLRRSGALDFDDLLLETLRLLSEQREVHRELEQRYRYVMVDEYQDTNGVQYEIVRALAGKHRNLCVVGDDDQSIYGWRGADLSKILGFAKDYPGAKVVRLETNYRSTPQILEAANRVIQNNPGRHPKTLKPALAPGAPVTAMRLPDEVIEAEYVVREIAELIARGKAKASDFAILFRTATQPRPFEAELRARALPYKLVGGMSFFDRKEVRDVLAYLKLLVQPQDETALLRIINCPPRGVGKTSIERVLAFAIEQRISAAQAFERAGEIEGVQSAAQIVQRLRERLAALAAWGRGQSLVALVQRLLEEVAYQSEVERLYPEPLQREQRWSGVTEILNFAENYQRRAKQPSLPGFLDGLALSAEEPAEEERRKEQRELVTLMTLHASKGLEFPRVYLVGLEEGLLPHARAAAEDSIDEERRLMYVGITRAQSVLTLTFAEQRAKYGKQLPSHRSRFLYELKGEAPPPGWRAAGQSAAEAVPLPSKGRGAKDGPALKTKARPKSSKQTRKRPDLRVR